MEHKSEGRPPVRDALRQRHRAAGRKDRVKASDPQDGRQGKPSETAGRKVKGAKAFLIARPA